VDNETHFFVVWGISGVEVQRDLATILGLDILAVVVYYDASVEHLSEIDLLSEASQR
jgi:hypothetical protein